MTRKPRKPRPRKSAPDFAMFDLPGRPVPPPPGIDSDPTQARVEAEGHGVAMILDGSRGVGEDPGRARPVAKVAVLDGVRIALTERESLRRVDLRHALDEVVDGEEIARRALKLAAATWAARAATESSSLRALIRSLETRAVSRFSASEATELRDIITGLRALVD